MLILDKPWLIYKNKKPLARVIMTRSNINHVLSPRFRSANLGTICLWNGFEDLGDVSQETSLKQKIRELLKQHICSEPDAFAVTALKEDDLSMLFLALQRCEELAVQLLGIKESQKGRGYTMFQVDDPEFADGLIYARNVRGQMSRWETPHYWKAKTEEQLQTEIHAYNLFLQRSIFDIIIERWNGIGSAEAHLKDGLGFDHENKTGIYGEMFDMYDEQDATAMEQEIYNLVADM